MGQAAPSLTSIVNSGVIPPGLHDYVAGHGFQYAAAADRVLELVNILITLNQHCQMLEARVDALETFANITPDPSNVF